MTVMNIRKVRMLVRERFVLVRMHMGLLSIPRKVVLVLVRMRHGKMAMGMRMPLGQMRPDFCAHQGGGNPESHVGRIAQHQD